MPAPTKGTLLAKRYSLIRKIGAGAATQTWLARDQLTRAAVALKIRVDDRITDADVRREWETGVRLVHAHIARVFEFGDDPDTAFYSLQYIDGPDMGVLAGAPLEHVLPPLAHVADALRYAHGKGVVHRDIKASNILLGSNGAPYLIDFGVAALSGTGASGGSVIAASPQSLAGEAARPADDIFALGGLIYELVSGHPPYSSSSTAGDIAAKIPAELVGADGQVVPPAIRTLVASMLDKDAAARPDAERVVAALAEAGYRAAPAPRAYVAGGRSALDETIAVESKSAAADATAPARRRAARKERSGITSRALGISFAVLLLLLVGVVFILPRVISPTVDETSSIPAAEITAGPGEAKRSTRFSENVGDLEGRDERVQQRSATDDVLGELVSKMKTLESRAVQRWGGLRFEQASRVYAEGDDAYLARDYAVATAKYREAITSLDILLSSVDDIFASTLEEAATAFDAGDATEAIRHYELAVAMSPGHLGAQRGYERARNLNTVVALTEAGEQYEKNLELQFARDSFEKAVELDPDWQPASDGLARVLAKHGQHEFERRMSEGIDAIAAGDWRAAQAAFRIAQRIRPGSSEPAAGLQQVELELKLISIGELRYEAEAQQANEQWEESAETYKAILEIDSDLEFARQGLAHSSSMVAMHRQIEDYITDPDSLSRSTNMRAATALVVEITRMSGAGPGLLEQKDTLSDLLRRAVTPLPVTLISDRITDVSVYTVGKLGSFETHELSLLPGTYVAVGSRPGYRDVRLEFYVSPEVQMEPVVVRCEEPI